ncbi:hypothetical protein [Moraxella lacunata]|uniref:hypothetical protein n=1 Tax=Moraxella lacunata TaxID=477 RepID=UPI003EE3EB7A
MFFIVKSSFDRTTIKLHFFLEKRAIFLIFHCKYIKSGTPQSWLDFAKKRCYCSIDYHCFKMFFPITAQSNHTTPHQTTTVQDKTHFTKFSFLYLIESLT